jgi:hypothetical protein
MLLSVIPERDDGDVRLGLGFVVRDDGQLDADGGLARKRRHQDHGQPLNRARVSGIVRAHVDQHSVKELDPLVLERAERDEAVVLRTLEGTRTLRQEQQGVEHAKAYHARRR